VKEPPRTAFFFHSHFFRFSTRRAQNAPTFLAHHQQQQLEG
jgi:hypothetical protein